MVKGPSNHWKPNCAPLEGVVETWWLPYTFTLNWKIVSPRISQASAEHLVASEPRKEANAQSIIDASQNMRAFTIIPQLLRWNDVWWSEYYGPLLNKQTDLTTEELAAEARPSLEDLLP